MVMMLHHLVTSVSRVDHTHQGGADHAPSGSVEVISVCQQLAVAVLGVLRVSEAGKPLAPLVQTHAQLMSQAGKTLNQLLKQTQVRT